MLWLWVLTFGALGVAARFAIDTWIAKFLFSFPFGTLAINILGCFIAGLCFNSGMQRDLALSPVRLAVIVGFCGGFTTFSGFGLQFMELLSGGRVMAALAYGIGSPVLCFLATAGGLYLPRLVA